MKDQHLKERWIIGSLLLNLFLSILKLIFAFITGSLALIAEAIHSFSDLVASFISFIGVKLSAKKLSNFPYGLYKIENITAIVISFFLFFASYEILKESLLNEHKPEVKKPEYAIFVITVAMVLTFVYSHFEKKVGERLNSPTLIADAKHIWADFLSSAIVLAGLFGVMMGYQDVDKYAAGVVALFILYSGYEIFKEGIKVLLDVSLSEEDIDAIKFTLLKHPSVVEIKTIRGRVAGSHKFVEIELLLNNLGLREAHRIVDELATQIKEKVQNLDSVVIHYEPVRQEGLKIAVLSEEDGKVKDFSEGSKIVIVDIREDGKVDTVKHIYIQKSEREIGKLLSNLGVDIVITKNHPEDFDVRFLISKAGILVWETSEDEFEKAVQEVVKSWSNFNKRERIL
ncbi:MAG: cation diffusion facilitator family transporter [Hydrogenothermaceae bacterium]|nr:cation diffusion facilitator family transporter [Hydrogenothermaceae bacterium]